ncbi:MULTISPECIES: efflux RND transporter permease subunit [Halomonadaceae]|uniref:Multidrug resistance protein MexB n=1 Tax=Vreelandella titanicae TaxID=664683 RepID=A0AAP9NL51_9GAMM|nr:MULTISPECIES: efflux RND transporter permease subunit [Halomonas]QKS24165.1 Multidrug resistance protein MexB [Halomonas titanicae]CDG54589.1 Acriflavin resistance protein [Halomonas sp. A3H3]SDI29771.1 Multidrug efflux pump subunit AcrB [Halomonas titanicae]
MFAAIIRHGILVSVITLILLILGIAAIWRIPVQMIPDLETRVVGIETQWPGATPQDIEKDILIEQEEFLRNVPNLQRMESTASSGSAEIELEFPFGVDLTETLIRVNNALSQVPSYPNNVDQPRIVANSFSANAFMYFNVGPREGNPRQLDMPAMRDYLEDNVRPRLESVAGVSEVTVSGGAERQMQLLIDPEALAARELSIAYIQAALQARNQDVSGGNLESGKRRYLLRTVGRFEDVESLEALILIRDGDAVTRLSDVAEVRQSYAELTSRAYSSDGQPVLSVQVRREPGANVIDIKRAMLDEVAALNEGLLAEQGMRMTLSSDDVRYVESSIANVWVNQGLGALFATLVMYAFLRSARATMAGVIGIPICTIAAFLGLLLAGRTLNVISLAGVAFAIGMTIDNTIVVLESIETQRRRGLARFEAALEGVKQVWPAVLASTLTTILVFVPIFFIQQEAGQLYSDIAVAISTSIIVSMVVAITVIPTLGAHIDFRGKESASTSSPRWVRGCLWVVDGMIRTASRRFLAIVLGIMGGIGIFVLLTPPAEYLPEGEEAKTFASMNAPASYNLATMDAIAQTLQQELEPHVGAAPEGFERGDTDIPPIRTMGIQAEAQSLRIIAETIDPTHIEALMDALTRRFERYPDMRAFAARGSIISSNDGGTRSITLDIAGNDLNELYTTANAIYQRAETVFDNPRIQSRPSALDLGQPLIEVYPDWERAAEVGLDTNALGTTVAVLTNGAYLDDFYLDDEKIDLYGYGSEAGDIDLDALATLPIYTPSGVSVPLNTLAEIRETVGTATLRRVDGRRSVTLDVIPPRSVTLEAGIDRMQREVIEPLRNESAIPANINVSVTGAGDQLDATRQALTGNALIALAIVYLLLVAIFAHWGYPLLILATIPLGAAGGIVGLWLMNTVGAQLPKIGLSAISQPFDMITMLGFLILIGTVVNNPILVVHQARENLRTASMGVREAVQQAVESRLRPIAMTTLTTLCGLSPLVFLPGEGTELYRGVGAIVLFGLLGTAIVTVTFLPALTVAVLSWKTKRPAS